MNNRAKDRLSLAPEAGVLGISLLVVSAIGILSQISGSRLADTTQQGRNTRAIENANRDLLSALKDAETGQRGYLLTGRADFLEPYNHALTAIPELLTRMRTLTQSSPDQRERLNTIEPLVAAKLQELKETIELRRSNRSAEALALVNAGTGKVLMDDLRTRAEGIDQAAEERLARFRILSDETAAQLRVVSTMGSAILFGFLILSAVTIFHGIKRREEIFRQTYESQKKLAITLTSIGDGVISTDAAGRIALVNPVAETLTGWKQQECLGLHISEVFRIVNEVTRDKVENPLERAIAEGAAVGLANHTMLIDRNGNELMIDDSAAPIRNERGEIIGAVLVFRDISERRKADREKAESALALQRSNEELQQFAFAASHDLRSPLNTVNNIAQLLAKQYGDRLDRDGRELIGYITDGASRMVHLVDDLLALAKIRDIDPKTAGTASTHDAFEAACRNLKTEVQATEASIIVATPLPVVAAHETHIVQVFQNLLSNGLKFRDGAPPKIRVSAMREDSEWIIGVTDNGIGIAPQYIEQIFQPFKRLHGRDYDGNGIGLSTCKKIVTAYGGRIWVESEVGNGSTFFFALPAAEANSAATATAGA